MARGYRGNATLLSPQLQPQSVASFDPITRRNTILVANIVPTLSLAEAAGGLTYPADRFYAPLGVAPSSTYIPPWLVVSGTVIYNQWDATAKQRYLTLDTSGNLGVGAPPFIHYLGHGGQATSYAPKNVDVSEVRFRCRARFPTSADYTTYGIGAINHTSNIFGTATDHFFQITRNTGNWELGSCDGSTISQDSVAGADGDLHEFEMRWNATNLRLYVDQVLAITKTTNMPTQSLRASAVNNTDNIDIVDVEVEWFT